MFLPDGAPRRARSASAAKGAPSGLSLAPMFLHPSFSSVPASAGHPTLACGRYARRCAELPVWRACLSRHQAERPNRQRFSVAQRKLGGRASPGTDQIPGRQHGRKMSDGLAPPCAPKASLRSPCGRGPIQTNIEHGRKTFGAESWLAGGVPHRNRNFVAGCGGINNSRGVALRAE